MKYSEIINIINNIENEFAVDKWTINNIHIWPLIRIELGFKLFYVGRVMDTHKNTIQLIRYIAGIVRTFINFLKYVYVYLIDFNHNDTINNQTDVVFLTYSLHRTLVGGIYYNRFCEPFVDVFHTMGMKTLIFEAEDSHYEYRIPRYKPSIFIQHRLDYLRIKNRIFRKKLNLENEKLEGFSNFIKFLEAENYGIINPNIQDLRYQVKTISGMSEYFKKIFNKIKPSLAFITNYYSPIGFAFNLTCHQANISSVDIQHGVVGEYHSAYGQWNKIPKDGYEVLPSLFWCWGEEEANAILKWNKNVSNFHRPFVGGNLWLNLWKNQNNNNNVVKYYDNQIIQIKTNSNKQVFILYTFDKFYHFPEFIINAMRLSSESFYWWIRIHYGQLDKREAIRGFLKERGIRNFELDLATDFPLPVLLRHIDVHVTATSSVIKEAEYFNVLSVLIHKDGTDLYSKEITSGTAVAAHTTGDLLKNIRLQLNKKNELEKLQKEPIPDNFSIIKELLNTVKCDNKKDYKIIHRK